MGCDAFEAFVAPSSAETAKRYVITADSASAVTLYNDVRTAVGGYVLNNISTTISLAVYIVLMEACKYL